MLNTYNKYNFNYSSVSQYVLTLRILLFLDETISQNNSTDGITDNCIQISEDAILNALDASEVSSLDIDFTHSITIEIGSMERAQFDNSLSLGKRIKLAY